ncbi:MAG: GDSL-like Lipase/Acylhydrolase family [Pseudonocardiales bacterium]|nr:GDSL-like Lipase/Acylhydrolase family [Pseudonocardiales bacterium]
MHYVTTTSEIAGLVHGAVELEQTDRGLLPHRLPSRARCRGADDQLLMSESQPSGVRLAFTTTATMIELDTLPTKRRYVGMPPRPDGIYDLLIENQLSQQSSVTTGDTLSIDLSSGSQSLAHGAPGTASFTGLSPGDKTVEIWLPHDETTLLVELRSDAPLTPYLSAAPRWVHYGSSISQGSNAASPSTTWPALASIAAGLDLLNLGFGGSALLDIFVAQTIAELNADLVTLEIGINIVNTDAMRRRSFESLAHGFLDTVRAGHPGIPLVVISPFLCSIHEDTPGPTAPDASAFARGETRFVATGAPADVARGKLSLNAVRETLAKVVDKRSSDDTQLHLIDGRTLYGASDVEALPLPDNLHPDATTHRLIARRAARVLDLAQSTFRSNRPSQRVAHPEPRWETSI